MTEKRCVACPDTAPPPNPSGVLCPGHTRQLLAALDDLPAVYRDLREVYGEPVQGDGGERVTVARLHPPIPIRSDVDAVLVEVAEVVQAWEERVRVALGLPAAGYASWGRLPARVEAAAGLLHAQVGALLVLPTAMMMRGSGRGEYGAGDAAVELVGVYRRAAAKAMAARPVFLVEVPCPARGCPAPFLSTHGGEGADAWCTGCGGTVAAEDYRALVADTVEETERKIDV